jgi:hypothetical protein
LKQVFTALKCHLKYSGVIEYILHEDVVDEELSEEVCLWAQSEIVKIMVTDPNQGLKIAIQTLLGAITTKYVLNWEDDWLLLKELNLDDMVYVMVHYNMNQVTANNRTRGKVNIIDEYKGKKVLHRQSAEWPIGPGLWKRSFIKERWDLNCDIYHPTFKGVTDPRVCWHNNFDDPFNLEHIGGEISRLRPGKRN